MTQDAEAMFLMRLLYYLDIKIGYKEPSVESKANRVSMLQFVHIHRKRWTSLDEQECQSIATGQRLKKAVKSNVYTRQWHGFCF